MHFYPRLVDECPYISDIKENSSNPLHLKIPLVYELLALSTPSNPWTSSSIRALRPAAAAAIVTGAVDPTFVVRTQPSGGKD